MALLKIRKLKKELIFIVALLCAVNFSCVLQFEAQEIEAKINIIAVAPSPARVHVSGRVTDPRLALISRNLSFLQNYADVSELGERFENVNLYEESGEKLAVKKLIAGEFQTDKNWISFDYDVKASVPSQLTSAAHVSWINNESGLLMLNDLLPQWKSEHPVRVKVSFEIPSDWKISTEEAVASGSSNIFDVKNIEKAIFLVGKNWREKSFKINGTDLTLTISGNSWQFTDDEASLMASSILEEYQKLFGGIPTEKARVFLLPFPRETGQTDRWRAETRGTNVTIVSGVIPLKSQAVQRLHEQLRHEIFHLWIPNALNLKGNYDWFYEGFAVYQALKTGVAVNQIRFQDFLNTLARAYDLSQNQNFSLLEISSRRWANPNSSVYGKGMIAAFLCDTALLRESKGKRSLSDIFRTIYEKYRFPSVTADANTAILEILKSYPELRLVVSSYIEGAAKINWENELISMGIESGENEFGTVLKVHEKLSGRQKDLLDKLGYNQWRKLSQKSK